MSFIYFHDPCPKDKRPVTLEKCKGCKYYKGYGGSHSGCFAPPEEEYHESWISCDHEYRCCRICKKKMKDAPQNKILHIKAHCPKKQGRTKNCPKNCINCLKSFSSPYLCQKILESRKKK